MKTRVTINLRRVGEADLTYEHEQSTDSAIWTVNHNFGRHPASVRLLTEGGHEFDAEVSCVSMNQLQVILATPARGFVICLG
jgi:hypothetical protein